MVSRAFSIEDGNLNSTSIITGRKVNYKDIDLAFEARPSGDVYKKIDAAAVKQSVKNILLTNRGEKPFDPRFGAGLSGLLFELIDADAEYEIESVIKYAIDAYEPRARLLSVEANPSEDYNSVSVKVVFQIINIEEPVTLVTNISRVR